MKLLVLFFSIMLSTIALADHHGDKECDGKKDKDHSHKSHDHYHIKVKKITINHINLNKNGGPNGTC